MKSKEIDMLALILVVIGGINWGLVGLLKLNLVTTLVGEGTITTIIYAVIGLSAVYVAATQLTKKAK